MKINNAKLENYINQFYGYGNLKSDYWFIGKEEAGNAKDIHARLKAWTNLKSPEITDNYLFHKNFATQIGKPNLFDRLFNESHTKIQKTWAGLIQLQYAIGKDELPSYTDLKTIQSNDLGRLDSDNALLELFPLPSRSHSDHNYEKFTQLDYLKNKESYKAAVAKTRIDTLKELISKHQPKFVIFYSTNKEFINYWKKITGGLQFKEMQRLSNRSGGNRYLLLDKMGKTTFCITQHPTYRGTSGEELLKTGRIIRAFSKY